MIRIDRLVKTFGTKRAVDGISFNVERGEVFGFLGPNGAGKSTTMRMITGFMPPTEGQVSIGGFDVVESPIEAKRLIGYLPENAAAYPDMTVQGFLNFAAELRASKAGAKKRSVAWWTVLSRLGAHQSIDTLSKATSTAPASRRRWSTIPRCSSWTSPPRLDPNEARGAEPDPRARRQECHRVSTHILEEVDAACTRAIIIDRGKSSRTARRSSCATCRTSQAR